MKKIAYKMEEKKGVSPVIATILLIGIVIVIALIVFFWFKGLTEESITKFGNKNIKLVCEDVEFEAGYSGGTLSISNTGTIPIYNINVEVSGVGGYVTRSLKELSQSWPTTGLNQGEVFSTKLDSIPEISSADEMILIPVLAGESNSGQKTHACGEKDGYVINL